MKILILNQDWFATELRALGHDVLTCGFEHHLEHRIECKTTHLSGVLGDIRAKGFSPDVILWHDNSMPALLMSGLESCEIPLVLYSVDTHHHHDIHAFVAPLFDHVMIAQRDYHHHFARTGTPFTWLPLWAPRFVEAEAERRWPVTFVGNLNPKLNPRRVRFFDLLKDRIPIHIAHGNYWEIFPFADIVVNQTVKGDLNFRVFEAMMCGSLLLTEKTPNGLLEIFKEGEHLITYTPDDVEEAAAKVSALLRDPLKMREMARCGREEILARHTAMHRAQTVEGILKGLSKRAPATDRHFISMVNHIVTSSLTSKASGRPCPFALSAAIVAAQQGLAVGATPTDTQIGYLVRACVTYDSFTSTTIGALTLSRFAERFPQNQILALAKIRNLLNSGQAREAEALATQLSSDSASQVFQFAEEAIQGILSA